MNQKTRKALKIAAAILDSIQDIIRDNRIRKLEEQVAELKTARIDARRIDHGPKNRETLQMVIENPRYGRTTVAGDDRNWTTK